jgi:hypothetical protein
MNNKSIEEIELAIIRKYMNAMFFEEIVLCKFDKELKTYIPIPKSTTELYHELVSGK